MSSYTILVMEDNEDINLLTKATLSFKGYNVLTSFNGEDGLKLLDSNDVDLVLLDVMMPDMDGWEVYHQLKADENTKNIPVIVITAKAQNIDKVLGLHIAKVDDYISKPFSPKDLIASIDRIFENIPGAHPGDTTE